MQKPKRDKWQSWLSEHAASSISVAEFCKRKGVSANSFYNWRRKLRATDSRPDAFVPVSVVSSGMIEFELPGGSVMRIPSDGRSLREVLKMMFEVGAEQ